MKFIYDNFRKKPFKPFYNTFIPRVYRKQWDFEYKELPTQAAVMTFWENAIQNYKNGVIQPFQITANKPELVNKKIIWQYWAQGLENAPEFVKFCFQSVDRFKGDYTVIRLTDETISKYLTFPEFVKTKRLNKVFKPVFFSDLLRISLINNYGGIWLDASILLTGELPTTLVNQNFFMFSRDKNSLNKEWGLSVDKCYFGWDEKFKVNYLSSIIFGKPHTEIAEILQNLMLYFWQNQESIPHYFFFQILINTLKERGIVEYDFPVVDDTLPHRLQFVLNEPFNKQFYEEITSKVSLHKLSFHKKWQEMDKKGRLTFYGHLIKNGV